jgi:hypothetical protein
MNLSNAALWFVMGDTNGDGIEDFGHIVAYDMEIRSGLDGSLLHGVTLPFPETFGSRAGPTGDVDGDGIPDLAVGTQYSGIPQLIGLTVWSGADLSLIRQIPAPLGGTVTGGAGIGDLNGDGVADIVGTGVVNSVGYVFVSSGSDSSTLLTIGGTAAYAGWFGTWAEGIGDVTGDGVLDIVVFERDLFGSTFGAVYVYSGASSSLVWTFPGPFNGVGLRRFHGLGDLNGDGIKDAFIQVGNVWPTSGGLVLDGASGGVLRSWWYPAGGFEGPIPVRDLDGDGYGDAAVRLSAGNPDLVLLTSGLNGSTIGTFWGQSGVYAAGDVNMDSRDDILVLDYPANSGILSTFTLAGLPQASVSVLQGGCVPVLQFAPYPKLGLTCTIGVLGAQTQGAGILVMSAPGSGSLPIGTGCSAWVDPLTMVPLLPFVTNASGNWYQPIQIAQHPAYAGLTLRMQAALLNPLVLTNALDLSLGY